MADVKREIVRGKFFSDLTPYPAPDFTIDCLLAIPTVLAQTLPPCSLRCMVMHSPEANQQGERDAEQ
jgi:hypothetical protein